MPTQMRTSATPYVVIALVVAVVAIFGERRVDTVRITYEHKGVRTTVAQDAWEWDKAPMLRINVGRFVQLTNEQADASIRPLPRVVEFEHCPHKASCRSVML